MIRFFCVTCRRIKRVRRQPLWNGNREGNTTPYPSGDCRWHEVGASHQSHRAFLGHQPTPHAPYIKKRKNKAQPQQKKRDAA